jgi:hypothetical protein
MHRQGGNRKILKGVKFKPLSGATNLRSLLEGLAFGRLGSRWMSWIPSKASDNNRVPSVIAQMGNGYAGPHVASRPISPILKPTATAPE